MENDEQTAHHPSADEARASLDAVARVNADFADRLVSPWWYYPGLGVVAALLTASMGSRIWWLELLAVAVALGAHRLLAMAWERQTGLELNTEYDGLARGWIIAMVAVLVVGLVVAFLVHQPVVTAVTAVVVFVATTVLGRRAESILRARLRDGEHTR